MDRKFPLSVGITGAKLGDPFRVSAETFQTSKEAPQKGLSKTKRRRLAKGKVLDPNKYAERKFTGENLAAKGFKDNRERHFYQRMLKAYLAGKPMFNFGFEQIKNEAGMLITVPKRHLVKFTDKNMDAEKLDKLLAEGYTDPGSPYDGQFSTMSHAQRKDRIFNRLEDKRHKELAAKEIQIPSVEGMAQKVMNLFRRFRKKKEN